MSDYYLGICGGVRPGNQDGSAALVHQGRIVAFAEEERFCRIKHARGTLPTNAIRFCLDYAGIRMEDVAALGFPGRTYVDFEATLLSYLQHHFRFAPPIRLLDHHLCHAATASYLSGFDETNVIVYDLSGDSRSTTVWHGQGTELELLWEEEKPNSIGLYYATLTDHLGFRYDDEEFKVMALAAYGEPREDLSWLLRPCGDSYQFDASSLAMATAKGQSHPSRQLPLTSPRLEERLGARRRQGEKLEDRHFNLAASVQCALIEVARHLVRTANKRTGCGNFALAGGVALNCMANMALRSLPEVERLFVQPLASDCGLSAGAAALLSVDAGCPMQPLEHVYLGPAVAQEEIEQTLNHNGIAFELCDDVAALAAREIEADRVVGWFQGRLEGGPRALGNRSILAHPGRPGMKRRINETVKHRELGLPLAPAILAEAVDEYFGHDLPFPYMTEALTIREKHRAAVPEAVHVDGTCRLQSVDRASNPLFHSLLSAFRDLSGIPAVINTSLNVRGQPIARTVHDALGVLVSTTLDTLVMGHCVVRKKSLGG